MRDCFNFKHHEDCESMGLKLQLFKCMALAFFNRATASQFCILDDPPIRASKDSMKLAEVQCLNTRNESCPNILLLSTKSEKLSVFIRRNA